MSADLIGRINEALDHENPYDGHCRACETTTETRNALLSEAAEQLAAKDAVLAAAKELCTDKWLSVGNPQTTYADGVADGREQAARDLRRVLTDGAS